MAADAEDLASRKAGDAFAEAVLIMARLRGPDGCPWDRDQSFDSIRKYTLEETYEVLDAIERRDWTNLQEELGDLLLQVLFYARMAAEPGHFTIADVVSGLNRKLVRRHPHVFGDAASLAAGNAASGIDSREVLRNWEEIKRAEKAQNTEEPVRSRLDSIPTSFPSLLEATRLSSKAAKSGFDWPDVEGVFAKLQEEILEIRAEMLKVSLKTSDAISFNWLTLRDPISEELGDLLFTLVNLARHLGVDPELALRSTNHKFRTRFSTMETLSTVPLEDQSAEQLEALWQRAKLTTDPAADQSEPSQDIAEPQ